MCWIEIVIDHCFVSVYIYNIRTTNCFFSLSLVLIVRRLEILFLSPYKDMRDERSNQWIKSDADWRMQVKVESMCTFTKRTSMSRHFSHVRLKKPWLFVANDTIFGYFIQLTHQVVNHNTKTKQKAIKTNERHSFFSHFY